MPTRLLATVALLGAALTAAPLLLQDTTLVVSLASVIAGIGLAVVASEALGPLAVALGALGALGHAAIAPAAPEVAGGFLLACVYGARAVRARTPRLQGAHVLLALAAGLCAQWLTLRYAGGDAGTVAAAWLVAGLLAATPSLIPVDDAVTFGLLRAARAVPEPARVLLLRAALLRRRDEAALELLPTRTARAVDRAFQALLAAGTLRARSGGASGAVLDQRIASHVDTLERVYAAAGETRARAVGAGDVSLLETRAEGDALAAEAAALAELSADLAPTPSPAVAPAPLAQ